jgi:hypothetical protein
MGGGGWEIILGKIKEEINNLQKGFLKVLDLIKIQTNKQKLPHFS